VKYCLILPRRNIISSYAFVIYPNLVFMELKKNPKADLEQYRGLFLQAGFIIAIGLLLLAFEWQTTTPQVEIFTMASSAEIEEEIVPITTLEMLSTPPPPPPPQIADILNIVNDDVEIAEEMDIVDTEADQNTQIELIELEETESSTSDAAVFFIVEDMPEFPGGEIGLRKWVATNIKYPPEAHKTGLKGKVFVRFVVTASGNVDRVEVVKSVDPLLDAEALRVVKMLPRWKPGMQRGRPVSVWYTLPINFQIQN